MGISVRVLAVAGLFANLAFGQESPPANAVPAKNVVPQAVQALRHLTPASDSGPSAWTNGPYGYDGAGNIAAIGSEAYVYDKVGRLKSATVRGPGLSTMQTQTFDYDQYGNLIRMAKLGQTVYLDPETANTNRLQSLQYDNRGNVIAAGAEHFDYDAVGMLSQVRIGTSGAPAIVYAYTADDERLFAFDVASNTTHWTVRGLDNKVLRDFKQSGATWSAERDYVYRDGLLLAVMKPGGGAEHYTLDHLGTPRFITDAAGRKIGYHVYWPYGEEWSPGSAQEANPLKFTGHERDADPTGGNAPLDYMHARYYGAGWGRFLAADPTWSSADLDNPQTWNRYAYVTGNPVLRVDPSGKLGLYPWQRSPEATTNAITGFVLDLVHYPEVKEAAEGYSSGNAKEKVLAGTVIGIAALDVGAMLLEPEEGAGEHLAAGVGKGGVRAAEGGRLLPFKDAERLVEVNNTLDRMEHGVQKYARDGEVFRNDRGLLPKRAEGYYKEFTVDTPGSKTRGPRRIVQGAKGETYYSDNHYETFVQIDPVKHP